MAALAQAMMDGIWFDRSKVEEAEYRYQEYLQGQGDNTKSKKSNTGGGKVVQLIAEARQKIQDSISNYSATLDSPSETTTAASSNQIKALQEENAKLKKTVSELTDKFQRLESRLSVLEKQSSIPATAEPVQAPTPAPVVNGDADDDEDDDVDLFGSSDEDDAEAERIKQERLAKYHDKKSKKPTVIAKSNIILDVKPWDDETDMTALEECVRKVETDGLVWGASKFVKVAYGISKLQITCVVEDDKVGTDFLEESITAFEDYVQSVDIVAFNKV